ncbi:MAG: hypothetical protein JNM27_20820 [Leptospirales bacterium]|nr:hypothetical protein [Leptospirales bacterium]
MRQLTMKSLYATPLRKWIQKQWASKPKRGLKTAAAVLTICGFALPLLAHHDQPASSADRLSIPETRIGISTDAQRGAADNRNIYSTTLSGEYAFVPGKFSASISAPYIYFDQKERSDAGRYGKPRAAATYMPYNSQFILGFRGSIGFPTGPDTDHFTTEDYWDGGITAQTGFRLKSFVFLVSGSGLFPQAHTPKKTENDELPWYLQGVRPRTIREIELKKVTTWAGQIGWDFSSRFSTFVGYTYRTPYAGTEFVTHHAATVPSIYREVSVGATTQVTDSLFFSLDYRYPLYRGNHVPVAEKLTRAYLKLSIPDDKEYKLFHESWTIAATWRFDTSDSDKESEKDSE